jgi:hypothetical protein
LRFRSDCLEWPWPAQPASDMQPESVGATSSSASCHRSSPTSVVRGHPRTPKRAPSLAPSLGLRGLFSSLQWGTVWGTLWGTEGTINPLSPYYLLGLRGLAGGPGFEPRLTESESAVLPLNYPPTAAQGRVFARRRAASIAKRCGRRKRFGPVAGPSIAASGPASEGLAPRRALRLAPPPPLPARP